MICSCTGTPIVYAADCAVGDHRRGARRVADRDAQAALVDPIMEDMDEFFGPGRYTIAERLVDAIIAAGWMPGRDSETTKALGNGTVPTADSNGTTKAPPAIREDDEGRIGAAAEADRGVGSR